MSATKHTPGPWKAELVPSTLPINNRFEVIADSPHVAGFKQIICTINGPHEHENYRANAALISSAPDLLEALEACRDCLIAFHRDFPQAAYSDDAAKAIRMGHSVIVSNNNQI